MRNQQKPVVRAVLAACGVAAVGTALSGFALSASAQTQEPAVPAPVPAQEQVPEKPPSQTTPAQPQPSAAPTVPTAPAQPARVQLQRVEITGTNIARSETETANPVLVISRDDIERSGQATVADYLRSLILNAGNSYNENFTIGTSAGGASVALRGLSQKNTLVLLNSRRLANYGFAQNLQDTYVDLNNIPASAVERIEVLKDGASSTYGSDAIAGVINVILRKNFRGAEVGVSAGASSEGGGEEFKLEGTLGFGNINTDRFNVMVSGSFYRREEILASDRPYSSSQIFRDPDSLASFGSGGYAFVGTSASGGFWRPPAPNPNRVAFAGCGTDGVTQLIPATELPGAPSGTACWYNLASYLTLMPEVQRAQLAVNSAFQLTSTTSLFADAIYANNVTKQKFSPGFISATSTAFDPATGGVRPVSSVVLNNPFGLGAGAPVTYSFRGVGGRNAEITTDFYRVLAGLRGTLGDWDWQGAVGRSESQTTQQNFNYIRVSEWNSLRLDPTFDITTLTTNTALNDRLRANFERKATTTLNTADLKASAEVVPLPGGALNVATGVEYRYEELKDNPDDLLSRGDVIGTAAIRTNGDRDVAAGFLELAAPVFVKALEVSLAGRYDRYSDVGGAFSPRAGVRFQPVRQLLLRSTWSRGFRAPSQSESAPGSQTALFRLSDPVFAGAQQSVAIVRQGNPDLKPERSTNFNIGLVYAPSAAFSAGFDYYQIKQTNVIGFNDFQFIVNNPSLFPGQITRDPGTNVLLAITERYRNLGESRTAGLNMDLRGALRTPIGRLRSDLFVNYLAKLEAQNVVGQPTVNYAGNNSYGSAFPRWRGTTGAGFENETFVTRAALNYVHSYEQQRTGRAPGQGFQEKVNSYTTFDTFFSYRPIKNLKLTAAVLNIFDRDPPYDAFSVTAFQPGVPYDPTLYDARGRYVRVGLEYKFF